MKTYTEKELKDFKQSQLQADAILAEACIGSKDRFHAGNCAHCEIRKTVPNYSGWARIYVQAGKKISKKQAPEFLKELERTDNMPYVKALKEDIEFFGLVIE
jgi:hypothetical protein